MYICIYIYTHIKKIYIHVLVGLLGQSDRSQTGSIRETGRSGTLSWYLFLEVPVYQAVSAVEELPITLLHWDLQAELECNGVQHNNVAIQYHSSSSSSSSS